MIIPGQKNLGGGNWLTRDRQFRAFALGIRTLPVTMRAAEVASGDIDARYLSLFAMAPDDERGDALNALT